MLYLLFSVKKIDVELGVVDHSCNPSYSGDRDWEDQLEVRMGKKLARPHLNPISP
jgi:hypothetical protein